jgi:hypothetical protein
VLAVLLRLLGSAWKLAKFAFTDNLSVSFSGSIVDPLSEHLPAS